MDEWLDLERMTVEEMRALLAALLQHLDLRAYKRAMRWGPDEVVVRPQ